MIRLGRTDREGATARKIMVFVRHKDFSCYKNRGRGKDTDRQTERETGST